MLPSETTGELVRGWLTVTVGGITLSISFLEALDWGLKLSIGVATLVLLILQIKAQLRRNRSK